jgi:hypothetical protein
MPAELRVRVYSYLIPEHTVCVNLRGKVAPINMRPLSRVCRLIRTEFAYEFCTKAKFRFIFIAPEEHGPLEKWLKMTPPTQRSPLTQNRNTTLSLVFHVYRPTYRHVDETTARIVCSRFGDVNLIPNRQHRADFVNFCKLASWWLWRAEPIAKNIAWDYDFYSTNGCCPNPDPIQRLHDVLQNILPLVTLPWVQKAWVRGRREREMKKEALNMLMMVGRAMQARLRERGLPASGDEQWNRKGRKLKRFFERW